MVFQSNRHKQIFETERLNLRKPTKKSLAVLNENAAHRRKRQFHKQNCVKSSVCGLLFFGYSYIMYCVECYPCGGAI